MEQEIKYIKLNENATVPTYGTKYSAGADLYNCSLEDIIINPGETVMIHTGIAMQIPTGFGGFVFARSGIALKRGLAPANKVGVIDSDYRGEIMVPLYNQSPYPQRVEANERIAQIVFLPYLKGVFINADELEQTKRAQNGFGSTGTKN